MTRAPDHRVAELGDAGSRWRMSTGAGALDLDRLPPGCRAAFAAQQVRIAALAEANAGLSERILPTAERLLRMGNET